MEEITNKVLMGVLLSSEIIKSYNYRDFIRKLFKIDLGAQKWPGRCLMTTRHPQPSRRSRGSET